MADVRIFRVGDGDWVVAVRGDLDHAAAADAASAIRSCAAEPVIVDLLHAHAVDLDALDSLVEAAGTRVTFVAERPLLDGLHVVGLRRYVNTAPTLLAALA
jgi:anti-anti-sigma regulatory factor